MRRRSAGNVVLRVDRRHLEHFEVGSRNLTESAEIVVVSAVIGDAAEKHIRTVVGHDHAEFLQRIQDDLVRCGIWRDVIPGFQPHAHPHGSRQGIAGIRSPMRGGRNKRGTALLRSEAKRAMDLAGSRFIVAEEAEGKSAVQQRPRSSKCKAAARS